MYLDKESKAKLEALSMEVFGIKNKYQKILNAGLTLRQLGAGVRPGARPLKTTTQQYFTPETLIAFLEGEIEEAKRQAAVRKI